MSGTREASAALRVSSATLTADQITAQLGIEPSKKLEKGTPISRRSESPRIRESALWILDSGLPESEALDKHLERISELVASHSSELQSLLADCEIDIFCGYTFHDDQGGFVLPREVVKRFASVPIEVVFALYHWDAQEEVGS